MLVLSRVEGEAIWFGEHCLRITSRGNGFVDVNFDGKKLRLNFQEWTTLIPGVTASINRIWPTILIGLRGPNKVRFLREELLTRVGL